MNGLHENQYGHNVILTSSFMLHGIMYAIKTVMNAGLIQFYPYLLFTVSVFA